MVFPENSTRHNGAHSLFTSYSFPPSRRQHRSMSLRPCTVTIFSSFRVLKWRHFPFQRRYRHDTRARKTPVDRVTQIAELHTHGATIVVTSPPRRSETAKARSLPRREKGISGFTGRGDTPLIVSYKMQGVGMPCRVLEKVREEHLQLVDFMR